MARANPLPLVLTMGEPGGISSEITVKAWRYFSQKTGNIPAFFVIDDPVLYQDFNIPIIIIEKPEEAQSAFHKGLPILASLGRVEASLGHAKAQTAKAVLLSIELAVEFCSKAMTSAMITNPIQKQALIEQGFNFPGHTEYLAELTKHIPMNNDRHRGPVMMLAGPELKTVPASVHIALAEVANTLTTENIIHIGHVVHESLKYEFGIQEPRITFAGLNPHAGEGGLFGREDLDIIAPALKQLKQQNINVVGPLPADTMFHKEARDHYDAAICMYHDQALIPVKTLDFHRTVNLTLGLPIIRTSPDHGCALDIAGKDVARPDSLISAINLAADLSSTLHSS